MSTFLYEKILPIVSDSSRNEKFRIEVIDAAGFFKRRISIEDLQKLGDSLSETAVNSTEVATIRAMAESRLIGVARLLIHKKSDATFVRKVKKQLVEVVSDDAADVELRAIAADGLGVLEDKEHSDILRKGLADWKKVPNGSCAQFCTWAWSFARP